MVKTLVGIVGARQHKVVAVGAAVNRRAVNLRKLALVAGVLRCWFDFRFSIFEFHNQLFAFCVVLARWFPRVAANFARWAKHLATFALLAGPRRAGLKRFFCQGCNLFNGWLINVCV